MPGEGGEGVKSPAKQRGSPRTLAKKQKKSHQRLPLQEDVPQDLPEDGPANEEAELARLRRELKLAKAANQAKSIASKPKKELTPEEKKWISDIANAVKKYLWHAVRFCNTDDKLQKLTAHVFDQWDLREYAHLAGDEREDAKVCWIAENSALMRMGLNSARNYANS